MGEGAKPKTEKELKKEAEKAAKLAKFEEKQKKLAEVKAAAATNKGKDDGKKEEKKKVVKKEEFVYQPVKAGEKKNLSGGMPDSYQPRYVEADWYSWWEKEGFFKPEYGGRDVTAKNPKGHFTLCIPPPNVTGTLHVGHALATSVEDSVTRWHRMRGATTLFNPGTDHAGIATQVVVEKRLQKEKGLNRHDIGREHFIEEVWRWVNEKGDVIYNQFRDMGASVDWDRAVFMMDPKMKRGVTEAFIRMYESGTIYRSTRLVNWSCSLRSAISDIEVDKKELTGATKLPVPGYEEKIEFGVIVEFAYKIKDSSEELVVATTRVETMLGDTAVCVHPEDERYKHLVGKTIVHPFVSREIPIITDDFVDREFGTGAVKITPAHDPNDYTVGQKHNLPFITCITDDGDMADNCGEFSGMKRFNARAAVMTRLEELGLFRGKKDNSMVVPICSRSKDIIEPILKAQWYVACDKMAANAVDAVAKGDLKIIPDTHVATWNRWLENSRDWCISRQLWWGHRIPAYFITVNDGGKTPKGDHADNKYWVSAHTEADALKKAAAKFGVAESVISLKWDEDVLDTWFSSGMWPFIIFGWPDKTVDLESFFPGALLETGHDILFFWVARMVFMAQELTGNIPFKEVFLHAMIRDAHGRKMSKSLGNVIDPRDVIKGVTLAELNKQLESGNLDAKEIITAQAGQARDYPNGIPECGTDALRFALMAYTSQGRDINLDVMRVQGYRHFCNKIWQAVRFTLMQLGEGFKPADKFTVPSGASPVHRWILSRLSATVAACNNAFETYTFPQATSAIYDFWLYDFCDIYLEAVKPVINGGNADAIKATREVLHVCTTEGLALLSPFMPFVTEELWQRLPRRASSTAPSIVVAPYPETEQWSYRDESLEKEVSASMGVVKTVRSLRSDYELQPRTKADLLISCSIDGEKTSLEKLSGLIGTLASSNKVTILSGSEESKVPSGCAQMTISASTKVFIALEGIIDAAKEKAKLGGKKSKLETSIAKIEELQKSRDYETKVPLGVRTNNEEKKNELKNQSVMEVDGEPFDLVGSHFDREFNLSIERENTLGDNHLQDFVEKQALVEKEKRISELCQNEEDRKKWRMNTQKTHLMGGLSKRFRKTRTNAFCKFYQILSRFPELLSPKSKDDPTTLHSLHLCEVPGHFLSAIEHFIALFLPNLQWEWMANSLNPHYEYIKACDMFLDDKLIVDYPNRWLFGENNSGDVTKLGKTLRDLGRKFDLVTSDGSTYSLDHPEDQESIVYKILVGETLCALSSLMDGGSFIMKVYSNLTIDSCRLFSHLMDQFEKVVIYKPPSSKSGNSERYLICTGFSREKGERKLPNTDGIISRQHCERFLACSRFFASLQIETMENNMDLFSNASLSAEDLNVLKDRAIEKVMKECHMNILRDSDIKSSLFRYRNKEEEKEVRPWMDNFKDNHVERLKELENRVNGEEFLRAREVAWFMADDGRMVEDATTDVEWTKDELETLNEDSALIFVPLIDEPIVHSIFVDAELLVALRSINFMAVNDMCGDQMTGIHVQEHIHITNFRLDHRGYIMLSVIGVTNRIEWIRTLLFFISLIGNPTLKGVTLLHENESSSIPLILSRFSASVFCFLSIIFYRVNILHPKKNSPVMMEFDLPNYPEDIPACVEEHLKKLLARTLQGEEECLSFVPLKFQTELYPLIAFYNNEMIKRAISGTLRAM
uniref:Cap-specific mRNA (nucleoside-2'-O-)-methyltransferase 2 n=1 Tax=Pristionchus pacificus TaxID=54126 RepID=A0A2A6BF34_PRIPA|eukprot:PDM64421.1 vars-2 [Pristionchus pacificus]